MKAGEIRDVDWIYFLNFPCFISYNYLIRDQTLFANYQFWAFWYWSTLEQACIFINNFPILVFLFWSSWLLISDRESSRDTSSSVILLFYAQYKKRSFISLALIETAYYLTILVLIFVFCLVPIILYNSISQFFVWDSQSFIRKKKCIEKKCECIIAKIFYRFFAFG